jgi:hypothetical protein
MGRLLRVERALVNGRLPEVRHVLAGEVCVGRGHRLARLDVVAALDRGVVGRFGVVEQVADACPGPVQVLRVLPLLRLERLLGIGDGEMTTGLDLGQFVDQLGVPRGDSAPGTGVAGRLDLAEAQRFLNLGDLGDEPVRRRAVPDRFQPRDRRPQSLQLCLEQPRGGVPALGLHLHLAGTVGLGDRQ